MSILTCLALALTACNTSKNNEAVQPGKELACPDGTINGGQTIITMDCNTVVQFEGNEFEASLDVQQWVKAGLHNAPKVLREIDQAASDAQIQFTQTCRVYNSCQMSSDEFNRELAATQQEFRQLREKIALLEASGGNPEVLRTTLAEVYQQVVPAEQRNDDALAVNLIVQVKDPPDQLARVLRDGETVHTGAKLVVGVEVSQPAHVYVFQRHEDEGLDVLFPNPKIQSLANPIGGKTVVRIPPSGQVFTVDAEDIGLEHIYVAVSLRALTDLEAALTNAGDSSGVETAMVDLFEEGNPECDGQSRGLELSDDTCGSMSRGLELASDGGDDFFTEEGSRQVQSAPGDDVIIQTFSFQHVE